jgi:hypothetical protein
MKTLGRVEVDLHAFLTMEVSGHIHGPEKEPLVPIE